MIFNYLKNLWLLVINDNTNKTIDVNKRLFKHKSIHKGVFKDGVGSKKQRSVYICNMKMNIDVTTFSTPHNIDDMWYFTVFTVWITVSLAKFE